MERSGWPEEGELVVCTVKKVTDFGAFVELDEYSHKEGLIHISEVASGWVKYIRDHVREGQKIVCKVLYVDTAKHHIDLSLKDVNEHQRREKIQQWKNEQKAEKWIQYVAKVTKTGNEELNILVDLLYERLGSVYSAFEKTRMSGISALTEIGVSKEIAEMIKKVAEENLKKPQVEIAGYVDLTSTLPDGIDHIKDALRAASEANGEDISIDISYTGAPRYRIHVIAPDYKKAESILKKSAQSAIKVIEKKGGTGEFHRYTEQNT
ncbi:translation initiation factor 2, alpha subunit (eIF-2alpha) [Candidatus Methanoperedens nitroreducens]|uniref:Translation initiation factor 2 subunit alpha n=1 Tax=Candidatus Methanoperedens nitratireducens TaxID=1392998 RepID=A0A062V9F2_9EURY|nr:translation initiation factor IF-2 subunit alpha [Candidatus Methanoperedens nitroreducens]KCZ71960.1 translation initiation factor 2, alpha subunit (eIF-2alpha) [Candidatus Methanoperedens nitroreducens]MDJ1422062.1 translation initiation factor IF-2 subunit alpha [Candidatus Methanoperedens sp.]